MRRKKKELCQLKINSLINLYFYRIILCYQFHCQINRIYAIKMFFRCFRYELNPITKLKGFSRKFLGVNSLFSFSRLSESMACDIGKHHVRLIASVYDGCFKPSRFR
jgi:hypothetical protein